MTCPESAWHPAVGPGHLRSLLSEHQSPAGLWLFQWINCTCLVTRFLVHKPHPLPREFVSRAYPFSSLHISPLHGLLSTHLHHSISH